MVMKPVTTTVKSIIFHTLRRYEFLCITRPNAIIFKLASVQKIAKKYFSVESFIVKINFYKCVFILYLYIKDYKITSEIDNGVLS